MLFDTIETVVDLMRRAATSSGLRTTVNVIRRCYVTGRKATEEKNHLLRIKYDELLPKWNYIAEPNNRQYLSARYLRINVGDDGRFIENRPIHRILEPLETRRECNDMTMTQPAQSASELGAADSLNRLMGLAVFGEKVAANTYSLMASLNDQFAPLLKKFSSMEGKHAVWFAEACERNDIEPDKDFADQELGYLISQVRDHHKAGDFEALAIVQGFIVESLAIATYEPFLEIADRYPGAYEVFQKALDEERYHVDWVVRYLRLRFFDAEDEFLELTRRVNVHGIDCIGGTMMNIADCLDVIGMSGADCAGAMMDGYSELLERVGVESKKATHSVVSLFMPLMKKHRKEHAARQSAGNEDI